ncbi:MAG: ATP-binding protein [Pseudomonadota bacterium]
MKKNSLSSGTSEVNPPDEAGMHDTMPEGFSRAGDFLYCGAAGAITIICGLMLQPLTGFGVLLMIAMFISALLLRYLTLRDARPVPVGVNLPKEQYEALIRLRALLNTLPQPVMLLSAEGTVETYNQASVGLFGDDMAGKHLSQLLRAPQALEVLEEAQSSQAPHEAEYTTTTIQERTYLFYAAPIKGGGDAPVGQMLVMVRDRTEQKKLERMRTDFIANASHELRTPLASMTGFIETLQGHAKDDAEARDRFLGVMAGQAERMLRLVEDLIGLSAIELNELNRPSEMVGLVPLAQGVCESLIPLVEKNRAQLTCNAIDAKAEVIGDRHELFRLLQNLCENAIKYGVDPKTDAAQVSIDFGSGVPPLLNDAIRAGDSAAQIAVRANVSEDDLIWVRVADKGEGIDRNDLPRLTERFYRVNPELSRSKGGTGLGLAIVKHVLQRHRGGLQIESVPGKGAAFTCVFVRAEAIQAQQEQA